jgi:hypothetical protein
MRRPTPVAAAGGWTSPTVPIFAGSYVLSALNYCSGRERAVLEEYPRYGGYRIAAYPWTFLCGVR